MIRLVLLHLQAFFLLAPIVAMAQEEDREWGRGNHTRPGNYYDPDEGLSESDRIYKRDRELMEFELRAEERAKKKKMDREPYPVEDWGAKSKEGYPSDHTASQN